MKKNDLKKVIKPLVKECIQEILLEEGLLSNVVSEVVRGVQTANLVTESTKPAPSKKQAKPASSRNKLKQQRKKLMEAIGTESYNGVDLFENTKPMSSYETTEQKSGGVDLGNPEDSGVDISSMLDNATRLWEAMK